MKLAAHALMHVLPGFTPIPRPLAHDGNEWLYHPLVEPPEYRQYEPLTKSHPNYPRYF